MRTFLASPKLLFDKPLCDQLSQTSLDSALGGGIGGGGGGCLAGETLVKMADGTEKQAKLIEVGEVILGFDSTIGNSAQTIVHVQSSLQPCVRVAFESRSIVASVSHPWFVANDQESTLRVCPTIQLKIDERLFDEAHKLVAITGPISPSSSNFFCSGSRAALVTV